LILVTTGTQRFPFDRIFQWVDALIADDAITEDVVAQGVCSFFKPQHFVPQETLSKEEFATQLAAARIVISHGGAGSMIGAVEAGKPVIVVPREQRYGEHVDDHQSEIVKAFAEGGQVLAAATQEELRSALARIDTDGFKPQKFVGCRERLGEVLVAFRDAVDVSASSKRARS
jgi:UDP-N-acetylglucosamine transferase subunit ALG13